MFGRIAYKKIRKNIKKTVLTTIIFSLVVFFSLFIFTIYENLENFLISQNVENPEESRFEIIFKKEQETTLFGTGEIQQEQKEKIKDLKNNPEIKKVLNIYKTDIPTSISINLLNKEIETDILLFSISDNFFSEENIDNSQIPVGISAKLLNFYNLQFAEGNFFPKLSEDILTTLNISVNFGKSTFFTIKEGSIQKKGKVKKISSLLPTLGITIPHSKIKDIFENLGEGKTSLYKTVGFLKNSSYITSLRKKFPEYKIKTNKEKIEAVKNRLTGVKYLTRILSIITTIILICFLIYIIYILLESNKKDFQVLRTHGASKKDILAMIFAEIFIYFILGSILSLLIYFSSYFALKKILETQIVISYEFSILGISQIIFIIISYTILVSLLTITISAKEWNKDFENS